MKKNKIQLQKDLSLREFFATYGTVEQCEAVLEKSRWPNGYRCPKCNGAHLYVYMKKTVKVFQCSNCRKQVSLTEDDLPLYETLFDQVVPSHVFHDPEQEQYFDPGTEKTYGSWLFRRLESEAQAYASYV